MWGLVSVHSVQGPPSIEEEFAVDALPVDEDDDMARTEAVEMAGG